MAEVFEAEAIKADVVDEGARRLGVTLCDENGRELTLTISPEIAAALGRIASEFAHHADTGNLTPTKMPNAFAIGSGRFEPIVLVRFENDTPYGLSADHAMRLGRALIAEAKQMASVPPPTRQ